jgi:hypothetical protein
VIQISYGYILGDPVDGVDALGLSKNYWERYLKHLDKYLIESSEKLRKKTILGKIRKRQRESRRKR